MPDPIPVVILGRRAVDKSCHKQNLGGALLKDAVERVRRLAVEMGIRGIVVHAISAEAKSFYEHKGFTAGADDPMTLILSLH